MELIWLVVGLLVLDLAVLLFATDTRPGLERSARLLDARAPGSRAVRSRTRHRVPGIPGIPGIPGTRSIGSGATPARTRRVAGG